MLFKQGSFVKQFLIYLLLLTLWSCSGITHKRTPASLGDSFQSLEPIQKVLAAQIGEQNANLLRNNMAKYLLQGAYAEDEHKVAIYRQMKDYVAYNMVMLKNDPDFAVAKAPHWTLGSEVDFFNELVEPEKITSAALNQNAQDFRPLALQLAREQLGQSQGDMVVSLLHSGISSGAMDQAVSESDILEGFKQFEQKIDPYFAKIRGFGGELAQSPEFTFANKQLETFAKDFIDYYYQNVDINVIKTIASELVDLGADATDMARAKVILSNVGPGLGKTLQQLGKEEGLGNSMQKVLEILEEEGKEVPGSLVRKVVDADQGGFVFKSIDDKALGTGTVAQVNKAVLKSGESEEVVALRFIKPGVRERAKEDIHLLNQFFVDAEKENVLYAIPNIKKIVGNIEDFLHEDLNIKQTIKNQLMAQKFYMKEVKEVIGREKRSVIFKVPKVYQPPKGSTSLHIQEFIKGGDKFSTLLAKEQKEMDFASRAIVRMWLDEALFSSGFLHGDLHQGNFKVTLLKEEKKILVTIFDFGMSDVVKPKIQRAFILLGAGAKFADPNMVHEAFISISPRALSKQESDEILSAVKAQMKSGNLAPDHWIAWGVKRGYELPQEIGTLARGGALISQLPKLVGNGEIYQDIAIDLAKKNTWQSATSFKKSLPLRFKDLGHISVDFVKYSCKTLFRKFFPKKN